MPIGLPLRTTKTTMDWATMPWYLPASHEGETTLASTSDCSSSGEEKDTTSALRPPATAAACLSDAPYDCVKETCRPVCEAWKAAVRLVSSARSSFEPTSVRLAAGSAA